MPLVKVRGEQVKQLVIKNEHISTTAAIAENKLDINWVDHYGKALESKFLLDYVQKNAVAVAAGAVQVDAIIDAADPHVADDGVDVDGKPLLGVIVENNQAQDKNKVIVREAITGEPVLDAAGLEVYGRMVWDPALNGTGGFVLKFFSGAEAPFTFEADASLDIQYIRRFTLKDVDERFSMNEKFVDGAADVTAHLNIEQLMKDIYTAGTVDRDGAANLATPLQKQIADLIANLASVENAKGASLVGIEDAAGKITATNVEGALVELEGRIGTLENSGGQEVEDTHTREAVSTNGYFLERTETAVDGEFVSLESRILDIETVVDTKAKVADDAAAKLVDLATAEALKGANLVAIEDAGTKFEATTVEGALAELKADDEALLATLASNEASKGASLIGIEDVAENFAATTVEGALQELIAVSHSHRKDVLQIDAAAAGVSVVKMSAGKFVEPGEDFDVFVNGLLQAPGIHYTEVTDTEAASPTFGKVVGIDFNPDLIAEGDVVIFKYEV